MHNKQQGDDMDDNEFWIAFWRTASIAVVLLAAIVTLGVYYNRTLMVENGYEQVSLQGMSSAYWQKVRELNHKGQDDDTSAN